MPISDLTGTKWIISDSPYPLNNTYNLSFSSNGNSYTSILFQALMDRIKYDTTITYEEGAWRDEAYKTVEITGGSDATNGALIEWFETYAVQQVEPEPVAQKGIFIGSLPLSKAYFGSLPVVKICLGETVLYEAQTPVTAYEIGFRGMSNSDPALTRTGQAVGATWAATSGVIAIDGVDLTKIFGGYVGNDGEELTWDSATSKYLHNGTPYTGNVFVKINRFFAKAHYENSVLDGYDLCFAPSAPDATYQDWFLGKDHCVIGCYKARGGGFDNGLQSKQGLSYTSATTADAIVTAYKLNSSTAYSLHEKWYNENAILQVLFMAIFATKQTTDVFPQDTFRHRSNDTRPTGYMDSYRAQSLFAYEPTGDSGKRGNMFLGIEDFVGWGYELVCGVKLNGTDLQVYLDYANFVYSGTYTTAGVNLSSVSSGSFIVSLQEDTTNVGLLVPKVASSTASDSTYFCDAAYTGGAVWYQGANNPSANRGLFFFYGSNPADSSNDRYAARLCGTPI